jgi:hypothetical protein
VEHELVSLINASNFAKQSTPGDTISSSTCTAKTIDVKVTETNVPWYLSLLNVGFINAQARVAIEQQSVAAANEPLAIPSPAPSAMSATLINESNGSTLAGPVTLSPDSSGTTWTGNTANVTFPTPATVPGSVPVGLRVSMGQGPSCGSQLECYDSGSSNGIAYTRVWSVSGTPGTGSPVAPPQAEDATLFPTSPGGCPPTGGQPFSGFISSSSSCSVALHATVLFAAGAVCGSTPNVALTLKVNGESPAMACTSATVQTTTPCTSVAPCVNTTWASAPVSAGKDSPDGPITLQLEWAQQFGTQPTGASGGTKGNCGAGKNGAPQPCTATFGTIQRAFNGAYDQAGANASRSGPIIGATVGDAANGNAVTSIQGGTTKALAITVNILNLGFQNATTIEEGTPVVLHTGGNQGTYAVQCGENNGASLFTTEMATGCTQSFAATTQPNPPICSNQPPGPAVCVNQNPGGGKVIEPGIDRRINGSSSATKCEGPNYWSPSNTLYQVEHQNPPDPRIVHLIIVDSGAWVGVTGASFKTPVRAFSTFYITGWSGPTATPTNKGGDPCFNQPKAISSNGLSYTHDDNPGNTPNVLLGHFIKYVNVDPNGGGTGLCNETTFGNCIAVLTK